MTTTENAIKITVTVLPTDKIEVRQNSEYAAWYTLWRVLPGSYTLERVVERQFYSRPIYVASVDAEVVEDYYASHFGGVPVGNYDIHQNAGKRGQVTLRFTPMQALKHAAVALDESGYDAVLAEAMDWLKFDASIEFSCIKESMGENHGGRRDELHWVAGHAESLAKTTRLYAELHGVKGRRDHKRKPGNEDQWQDPKDTHAARDNREWNGSAY